MNNVKAASQRLEDIKRKAESQKDIKLAVIVPEKKPEPAPMLFWDMFADWFDIDGDQATLTDEGKRAVVDMHQAEEAELDRNFREAMAGLMTDALRAPALVDPTKLQAGDVTPDEGAALAKILSRMVAYAGFLQYTIELMQTDPEV